jgi:hypothetical protein
MIPMGYRQEAQPVPASKLLQTTYIYKEKFGEILDPTSK